MFCASASGELVRGERHLPVAVEGLPVEVADLLALGFVADDDEVPAARVRPAGRLERDLHALFDDVARHRSVEIEALAHGAGGGQEFIGREIESGGHGREISMRDLGAGGAVD
jgi:hypothetical protein